MTIKILFDVCLGIYLTSFVILIIIISINKPTNTFSKEDFGYEYEYILPNNRRKFFIKNSNIIYEIINNKYVQMKFDKDKQKYIDIYCPEISLKIKNDNKQITLNEFNNTFELDIYNKTKHILSNKKTVQQTNYKIPKIIQQIWVGPDDIDIFFHKKLYMSSYKNILDNSWKYRLWGNDDITRENFPITYDYIQQCISIKQSLNINPWSSVADLMKFEIIYHHGGFYFDTNIELTGKLDHLVNNDIVLCNETANIDKYMSCGFFASVPKSKYLKSLLSKKNLDGIDFSSIDANKETGPWFFRKSFPKIFTNDIYILPTYMIYSKDNCVIQDSTEILFPCKKHPRALAVDHFYFGASWAEGTSWFSTIAKRIPYYKFKIKYN